MEFYSATNWDGPEDQFRVMRGKKWVRRCESEPVAFFSVDGALNFIREILEEGLGIEKACPPDAVLPDAARYTPVIYRPPNFWEEEMATKTRTVPCKDKFGQDVVWIFGANHPVLLQDLRLRC